MSHGATPIKVIEAIIEAVAGGADVIEACFGAEINRVTFYRHINKNPELYARYQEALETHDEARTAKALHTFNSAMDARDEHGYVNSTALRAALVQLYNKGVFVDSRKVELEHSGSVGVNVTLADLALEAEGSSADEESSATTPPDEGGGSSPARE